MREVKIIDGKLKCSRCGKIKPVEMFSKGHNKSGYKSYCKVCASADYFKNRDYNIQKRKEHYQNNKEIYAEYGRKRRTEKADELTRDHVIPLTKGGGYTKSNIVPCCKSCNSKKHNYDMETWYRKQPFFSEENLLKIKWLSDNRKVVNL